MAHKNWDNRKRIQEIIDGGDGNYRRGGVGGARCGGQGNNWDYWCGRSKREWGDNYLSKSYDSTAGRRRWDQSIVWDGKCAN